jgi:SpoVK/Ycf46/Vps4 family AAA+-type ATPase
LALALVGEFIGSTQAKIKEKLDAALGGVLFIDEAHRLVPMGRKATGAGSFKEEAMGVLISAMTSPEYQDNLLIVFAGYTKEMDYMLSSDPGLKRRIGRRVEFADLSVEAAENILHLKLSKLGYKIHESCHGTKIQNIIRDLKCRPGWGNIGDISRGYANYYLLLLQQDCRKKVVNCVILRKSLT